MLSLLYVTPPREWECRICRRMLPALSVKSTANVFPVDGEQGTAVKSSSMTWQCWNGYHFLSSFF